MTLTQVVLIGGIALLGGAALVGWLIWRLVHPAIKSAPPPVPPADLPSPSPPAPPHRPFYWHLDFWLGFVGWFIVNGVWWWIIFRLSTLDAGDGLTTLGLILLLFSALALPANLGALLLAAILRRRVAGGLLAALALNWVIALTQGAFTNAMCGIPFFSTFGG